MKRLVLLMLVLSACDGASPLTHPEPKPCNRDADCNLGEVCLDIGCAAPDQNLVVEVVPPPSATKVASQEFANVDASKQLDFILGTPASLDLHSTLYPLEVSLRATPLFLLDYPYSLPASVIGAPTTVWLAPGTYRIRATPTDGVTPPLEVSATLPAPGAQLDISLQFPPQGQLVKLHGSIVASRIGAKQPNLRYALQLRTSDRTPLSQPARTGQGDAGPFEFNLVLAPPTDPGQSLELTASPEAGVGPSITVSGTLASVRALITDGGLSLGDTEPVQIHGEIDNAQGAPLPDATVSISADLPGSARYVSAQTKTDPAGQFTLPALHRADGGAEAYKVLIIPPDAAGLAIAEVDAVPDWASARFAPISTAPLTQVSGRVLDSDGTPTPGATVQATPVAHGSLPLVSASATASADGTFALALTPGTYHFDFSPPLALVAPSSARGPLTVEGAHTALPELRFSAPQSVSGTVAGADGRPVEGALVRVYHVLASSHDGAGGRVRSTLLARGQVLAGGGFSVVLPAPPSHAK
jgi:protocatechuate 3,4-dioxygenase beta subunit